MVGLTRVATYFPRRRLERAHIAKAWGGRAAPGTRTVAAWDEDALTLAVDATLACLGDADPAGFDALYFASTSAPYLEKQVASVVATAADLPRAVATADFGGSIRCGVAALAAACDGVASGRLAHALVAAADVRLVEPGSELEAQLGDGAAALAVGREGVIAELVAAASVAEEFTYLWRTDEQRYVQVADARFGNQYGYARDVPEAVKAALRKAELPPAKVARLVLSAPDGRTAADAAKRIGVDAKVLEPGLAAEAGMLGSADPLVLLAKALETAQPGEFVVAAAYGEGADALVFRVTDAIAQRRPVPVAERLAGGIPVQSYERWLRARSVLPSEVAGELVSTYIEWRELKQDTRLYGSRCSACGMVQYPQAVVCQGCHAREGMVDHKLAKTGKVFTFTIDNLAQVPEHPMPMVIADLDGGGRIYLQGTDCADGDIDVDKPLRLTFRRLHEAAGNRNYYWKVRPA
ncbi:MAG: OB-fold domain-containing protein [bacterium]|nr:OB-fold domain-containing protein [bacterium]